jgi:hypothetical protein
LKITLALIKKKFGLCTSAGIEVMCFLLFVITMNNHFFSIYKTDVVQAKLLITEPVKLLSSQTLSNMSVASPKTFENNSEKPVPNWIKKRSLTESKGNDLDKNKKKSKFQL